MCGLVNCRSDVTDKSSVSRSVTKKKSAVCDDGGLKLDEVVEQDQQKREITVTHLV